MISSKMLSQFGPTTGATCQAVWRYWVVTFVKHRLNGVYAVALLVTIRSNWVKAVVEATASPDPGSPVVVKLLTGIATLGTQWPTLAT